MRCNESARSDNAFCLKCKRRHRKKSIRISEMLNRQFFIPFGYRTQCIFIYTLNNEHQQKATCYGSQWEVSGRRQTVGSKEKKIQFAEIDRISFALLIKVAPRNAIVSECWTVYIAYNTYEIHLSIEINNIKPIQILELTFLYKQFVGTSFYVLLHINLSAQTLHKEWISYNFIWRKCVAII